jgi:hypothetical protein
LGRTTLATERLQMIHRAEYGNVVRVGSESLDPVDGGDDGGDVGLHNAQARLQTQRLLVYTLDPPGLGRTEELIEIYSQRSGVEEMVPETMERSD